MRRILTLLGTVDEGMTAVIHDMMVLRCCGLLTKGITASQNPCKIQNINKDRF